MAGTVIEEDDRSPDAPWYANGLRFACTQCGRCCGGEPGSVRASDAEIATLAGRLGLDDAAFRRRYTRMLRRGDVGLKEKPNGECVFYDRERGCSVYADRPRQCRTWPFWRSTLHSPESWAEEARGCPGMDSGPRHSALEIAETSRDDGTSASVRAGRSGLAR